MSKERPEAWPGKMRCKNFLRKVLTFNGGYTIVYLMPLSVTYIPRPRPTDGSLIVLSPCGDILVYGSARACHNNLNDTWLVTGQNGGGAYVVETRLQAAQLCGTVDHFNRTGAVKAFKSIQLVQPTGCNVPYNYLLDAPSEGF